MDKRFLLTILLCFAISVIYMDLITPDRTPQNPAVPGTTTTQPPINTQQDDVRDTVENSNNVVEPAPVIEQQTYQLTNSVLDLEFSNQGAALTRASLFNYSEEIEDEQALELISPQLESGQALLLQVPALGVNLSERLWEVVDTDSSSISFRTGLGADRSVTRRYELPADGYELTVTILFEGSWSAATDVSYEFLGANRIRFDKSGRAAAYPNQWVAATRSATGSIGQIDRGEAAAIESGEIRKDQIAWGALESNYFAQVIRPLQLASGKVASSSLVTLGARPGEREAEFNRLNEDGLQGWPMRIGFRGKVESQIPHQYAVFLGPKDPGVLEQHSAWEAIRLIDYGFFGWLVRPFLWLLRVFDGFIGSWGIAIILLTFCIRGVLHPVNKKNQRQMQVQQQGMARLKPQMEEIKEKYKNDPPAQHRKMQELFRSEGVNPAAMFGGCLFIFLQLPVWLALINTFTIAIELRQAGFLWVADLTHPDMLFQMPFSLPFLGNWFNLLPILYVIISIINQKMMPQSDDPQIQMQQKMMSFMLIAFGFIFYSFASGLMVYFITSALIGIAEQKMIRRDLQAAGIVPVSAPSTDSGGNGPRTGPAGPASDASGKAGSGKSGPGKSGPARPGQGKVRSR